MTQKKKFILIVGFLLIIGALTICISSFLNNSKHIGNFGEFIDNLGWLGVLLLVLIQIAQVIIAVIPAEPIEAMAGMLYGVWGGIAISLFGSIIATVLIFKIMRNKGMNLLYALFNKEKVDKWSIISDNKKFDMLSLIIFMIPWAPKDLFTYLAGARKTSLLRFLTISTFARIPSILSSVLIGNAIENDKFIFAFVIFLVATIIGILGIKFQDRLLSLFSDKHSLKDNKRKSILLTEASSLTSRETLAALKEGAYTIDILSSSKYPLSRFTNTKHKIISIVNVNENPEKYFEQLSSLLEKNSYDAIIPTHETAWLLSESSHLLPSDIPVAISSPKVFGILQSKIEFAKLLDCLEIPQPKWIMIPNNKRFDMPYPYWRKLEYGTAGRTVFEVKNAIDENNNTLYGAGRIMAQQHVNGVYGQVQAAFCHGKMIGVHNCLQKEIGAGGSAAARISRNIESAKQNIDKIGTYLSVHGCITIDYIFDGEEAYFIECNPRMIEPGNADKSGVNFPELLIQLSCNTLVPNSQIVGKENISTHSLLAIILGTAERTLKRKDIFNAVKKVILRQKPFEGSEEILTPIQNDFRTIMPLVAVFIAVMIKPKVVHRLVRSSVKSYSIELSTIELIRKIK